MNYYNRIKQKLINNENYKKVKDYTKNKKDLIAYYNIGKLLIETKNNMNSKYKNYCIRLYINRLKKELDISLSDKNLELAQTFYLNIKKGMIFSPLLTWTHYRELLTLKDINKINYYIRKADDTLTLRKLKKQIDNSKKILKKSFIKDINIFFKQLGFNFIYIDNEYHITKNNIIDLILYNKEYNAYVVVSIKLTKLKAIYIGQIWNHMNYINKTLKKDYDNDTIGIVLRKINNKYVIEYCSDKRIYNTTYTFS